MKLSSLQTKDGKAGLPLKVDVTTMPFSPRSCHHEGANEALKEIGSLNLRVDVEKLAEVYVDIGGAKLPLGKTKARVIAAKLNDFIYVEVSHEEDRERISTRARNR